MSRIGKIKRRSERISAEPSKRSKLGRLVFGGLLLIGIGVGAGAASRLIWPGRPVTASTAQPAPRIEKQNGPWGEIEVSDIQIDPPDEYASNIFIPTNHGVWFFGTGYDRSRVLSLFDSADLTDQQRSELSDPARWTTQSAGISIKADSRTAFGLSRTARSRIYRALSEFRENFFQASPFMFPKDRADDWFSHSGLTAETMHLISGLFYERGNMLCFSDVEVLDQIGSAAERVRLIAVLSRTPSVLVNLRIPPDADPEPLIRYWHQPSGAGDTCQLIKSVAQGRNGGSIDITLLLPPFVREHVYHYPKIPSDHSANGPDCLWSSLSFAQAQPYDKVMDEAYLIDRLKKEYEPAQGPFQSGDVLMLVNGAGKMMHYCVHIAGNIVFTKNGGSVFAPWVFMRFQDVIGFYSSDKAPGIICFRRKFKSTSG